MYKRLILVLFVTTSATWGDMYESCGDNIKCVEENLIKIVDKLDTNKTIPLLGETVVIEKTKEVDVARKEEDIFDRLRRYLTSHELKIRLPNEDSREFEARKRKWTRFLLPILAVLKIKAMIILPAFMTFITLISFDGITSSIIAVVVSIMAALKGSSGPYHAPKISLEVVPPLTTHIWNRAGIESYPLGQGYHTIS